MHQLPKRRLYPLLMTLSDEMTRIRTQSAGIGSQPVTVEDIRAARELWMAAERLFRIMSQRRRLNACYWAGWRPGRVSRRCSLESLKWLVRREAL